MSAIAFLIRILFGVITYINNGTSNFIDDWDYISYANNILSQGIWVPDLSTFFSDSYEVGVAFPLVLAIIFTQGRFCDQIWKRDVFISTCFRLLDVQRPLS